MTEYWTESVRRIFKNCTHTVKSNENWDNKIVEITINDPTSTILIHFSNLIPEFEKTFGTNKFSILAKPDTTFTYDDNYNNETGVSITIVLRDVKFPDRPK